MKPLLRQRGVVSLKLIALQNWGGKVNCLKKIDGQPIESGA
jgi:hypothetical protein